VNTSSPSIYEELGEIIDFKPELIFDLSKDTSSHYKKFPIHHGRKKTRWIHAPSGVLKLVQRAILDELLYDLIPHPTAHGFYPGRSILTNAEIHTRKAWVISMDIKDFFPTTKISTVKGCLKTELEDHSSDFLDLVIDLCCLDDCLPQGAPTSPHLANICFKKLDEQLLEYSNQHDLAYSRYADDMTFSGQEIPDNIETTVERIIACNGYKLAREKTKLMAQKDRQSVTGLVVNDKVSIPRKLMKLLRAISHDTQTNGWEYAISRSSLIDSENQYWGYMALQKMVKQKIAGEIPKN
jgi:retron-type reverse transcriptase